MATTAPAAAEAARPTRGATASCGVGGREESRGAPGARSGCRRSTGHAAKGAAEAGIFVV